MDELGRVQRSKKGEDISRVSFGDPPATEECYQLGAAVRRSPFIDLKGSEVQVPVASLGGRMAVRRKTEIAKAAVCGVGC